MVDIEQKILSKLDLYTGTILMPKGFEIDKEILKDDIVKHNIQDCHFPFSKEWDKLHTYLREHIYILHGFHLINRDTYGYMFKSNDCNLPDSEVN